MSLARRLTFSSVYFLFLLPLFFVWHGYTENYGLVSFSDAFALLLLYWLNAVLLTAFFYLFFRSVRKAAVYTFFLLYFHFFFGSTQDFLKEFFSHNFLSSYSFILSASFVAFIVLFIYLKRTKRTFVLVAKRLNLILLILLAVESVSLGIKIKNFPPLHPDLLSSLQPCDSCDKPDVYLIIADEYAGYKQLQDQFHFDNTAFFTALANRGFHVVPSPRSNYEFTQFSVASITDFSYLPLKDIRHTLPDVPMILRMIANNTLTKFFYQQGYKVYNNGIFDIPGQPRQAHSSFLPNKTQYITAQTFISRVYKDIYFNLITRFKLPWAVHDAVYYNKEANAFLWQKTVETAQRKEGPKFSYTHLQMPHPPYYFDSSGREITTVDSLMNESNKSQYLSYLKYANAKLLSLVDAIQKASAKPPVIVLMSDHGFRNYSFEKPSDSSYYFNNMLAISLPKKNYSLVPDSLSAVNIFRVVLNTQFNQHLPLLPDSSFTLKD